MNGIKTWSRYSTTRFIHSLLIQTFKVKLFKFESNYSWFPHIFKWVLYTLQTEELTRYVYMDTNIVNKGLIRIKMLYVDMSIGKF